MRAKLKLLTLATMTALAGSATARAATVDRFTFKGTQVFTEFSGSNTITCADGTSGDVFVSGFISGAEQMFRSGNDGFTSNGVNVTVFSYANSCTGTSFGFAEGVIPNGLTPPNPALLSATLRGSGALLLDFGAGGSVPFSLNVSVQGTGPISAGRDTSVTRVVDGPGGPTTIVISHSANANRSGTATGTITIEGFTIPLTFTTTTLSRNGSSQIVVNR